MYQYQSSSTTLLYKVYAVVAVGFAARGCEACDLCFEDFERTITDNNSLNIQNECRYVIHHNRAKAAGQLSSDRNVTFIVGPLEVSIIDEYIGCFPLNERKGRFFRKLNVSKKWKHRGN